MGRLDPLPPAKVFKPKFNLPALNSYEGCAPEGFWDIFPSNLNDSVHSLVNGYALRSLAEAWGFPDTALLDKVCQDLNFGAAIGCKGEFRRA